MKIDAVRYTNTCTCHTNRDAADMSEFKYPNESQDYRKARDELLEEEKALVEKVKAVAEKRRQLPLGGKLNEDPHIAHHLPLVVWPSIRVLPSEVR